MLLNSFFILRMLSVAKPLLIAGSVATFAIGGHLAYKAWISGKVSRAMAVQQLKHIRDQADQLLKESEREKVRQVEQLQSELERQSEIFEKMQAEVTWARQHVAMQEKAIKALREGASNELAGCLDMHIDSDVLRF